MQLYGVDNNARNLGNYAVGKDDFDALLNIPKFSKLNDALLQINMAALEAHDLGQAVRLPIACLTVDWGQS